MKRLLIIAFLCLILTPSAWPVTYYACATANINAANEFNAAQTCDGTAYTFGTGGFPESGATLDANAYTVTINVDINLGYLITLVNSNAAGSFTVATSLTPLTLICNIGASSGGSAGVGLTITGDANAANVLTIGAVGTPVDIYGGSAANKSGVMDSHTLGTVIVYADITGGSNASAYGYRPNTANGTVNIIGNATGAVSAGIINMAASTVNITGNCIGSSTLGGYGCQAASTGPIILTGSIINGTREVGVIGTIQYIPGTYGSTNYVKFDGGGTPIYMSLPPAAAGILTTSNYINKDSGAVTAGTATSGGSNFISMMFIPILFGAMVILWLRK